MDELKPCPVCRGPAANVGGDYVTCGAAWNPSCMGHMIRTSPEHWNTRPAPSPADAGLVERLRALVPPHASIRRAPGWNINPDGPEAASRIEALTGEYERGVERRCTVCTAVVAQYPKGMCCHCTEMPWPAIRTLKAGAPNEENDHA